MGYGRADLWLHWVAANALGEVGAIHGRFLVGLAEER